MTKVRKAVYVIQLVLFSSLLVACSGTSNNSANHTSNAQSSSNNNQTTITFNDVVLVDDDYVTIKLLNFYELNRGDNTDACITFSVTNHLDRDIIFNVEDTYTDDQSVVNVGLDGNGGPKPGKTKEYGYKIQKEIAGEYISLESIEDLYHLNGTFEVLVLSEDGKYLEGDKERNYPFDFSDLK